MCGRSRPAEHASHHSHQHSHLVSKKMRACVFVCVYALYVYICALSTSSRPHSTKTDVRARCRQKVIGLSSFYFNQTKLSLGPRRCRDSNEQTHAIAPLTLTVCVYKRKINTPLILRKVPVHASRNTTERAPAEPIKIGQHTAARGERVRKWEHVLVFPHHSLSGSLPPIHPHTHTLISINKSSFFFCSVDLRLIVSKFERFILSDCIADAAPGYGFSSERICQNCNLLPQLYVQI